MTRRTIGWFSCGAASAVAIKLILQKKPDCIPVYCETGAEHSDNARFLKDCEKWFGTKVKRIRSTDYKDTWDVWNRRKYLAGIQGAPCTVELKVVPRLSFQRPDDVHVFGYTSDRADVGRAERFRLNYPEIALRTPLIEQGLDKAACFTIIRSAGIDLPKLYFDGFPNNNCIPCVKATSPAYWSLVRRKFPRQFSRMAKLSRRLGVRLCRLGGKRIFIDEIPTDYTTKYPLGTPCDFLCHAAEKIIDSNRLTTNRH
jgi:hypothetical protein